MPTYRPVLTALEERLLAGLYLSQNAGERRFCCLSAASQSNTTQRRSPRSRLPRRDRQLLVIGPNPRSIPWL
jgi:hypothetical protein